MTASIFNAQQYLDLYPALTHAHYTPANAWLHYQQYGAYELRAPNAQVAEYLSHPSLLAYAQHNPDVLQALGVALPVDSLSPVLQAQLLLHYTLWGHHEDRPAKLVPDHSTDHDLNQALQQYVDLYEQGQALEATALRKLKLVPQTETTVIEQIEQALDQHLHSLSQLPGLEQLDHSAFDQELRTQLVDTQRASLKAKLASTEALQGRLGLVFKQLYAAEERLAYAVQEVGTKVVELGAVLEALYLEKVLLKDPPQLALDPLRIQLDGSWLEYEQGQLQWYPPQPELQYVLHQTQHYAGVVAAAKNASQADAYYQQQLLRLHKAVEQFNHTVGADQGQLQLDSSVYALQTMMGLWAVEDQLEQGSVVISHTAGSSVQAYNHYQQSAAELTALNSGIQYYKQALKQMHTLQQHQQQVDQAVQALAELGYQVVTDHHATAANDVVIYHPLRSDLSELHDFGLEGSDLLYIGPQFSFIVVEPDTDLSHAYMGHVDSWDIFAQQQGEHTVLYIETTELAGTATGAHQLHSLLLHHVQTAQLHWHDEGYLSLH